MWSKVWGANNSERLFEGLIRYKKHKDLESKRLKTWCPSAFLYQFIIMDFTTKNDSVRPTASVEGDKDESLNGVYLEVVDSPMMTPTLLHETEASKAMTSNMDYTMPA